MIVEILKHVNLVFPDWPFYQRIEKHTAIREKEP
jgi:hypothetical protein